MQKLVLITMGSQSDAGTMKHARDMLDELRITNDSLITSAHRTPERMAAVARGAQAEGFKVIISGAGGSAHLPGMSASETVLPVIGVAVLSKSAEVNNGFAAGSMIGMPGGVPLLFAGFGKAGAKNAALAAARMLAIADDALRARLIAWIEQQKKDQKERPDYDAPE